MAVRRSSAPLDDASLYGEYPFLPGAETLLQDPSWTLRGLFEDRRYDPARVLGRARILAAADDPRAVREVAEFADASPEVRYLSFVFARVALACAPSFAALRRWAVAESKRSSARLENLAGAEQEEEILAVAGKLQVGMSPAPGGIGIPLVEYIRLAAPIREADFRLVRQDLRRGEVEVRSARAARLLEEAFRRRLAEPVPLNEDVVQFVRGQEKELFEQLAARMPLPTARAGVPGGALLADRFPPCIRKMRRTLQQGENLSHAGRFALAAFLHRAGADAETIVDAYRGAPDFDESITRYQVEHITQHGGGAGYTPPECETLRSHGLCVRDGDPTATEPRDRQRDELCFEDRLHHPLQYYQIRGGSVVERAEDEPRPGPASRPAGAPGTPGPPGPARSTGRR